MDEVLNVETEDANEDEFDEKQDSSLDEQRLRDDLFLNNNDYNQWLDNLVEPLAIPSPYPDDEPLKYYLSKILYYTDSPIYSAYYDLYIKDLIEQERQREADFKDRIIHKFPHIIAYHYHYFETATSDEIQRLSRLGDVWEGISYFLYALVMAEVRSCKIPLPLLETQPDSNNPTHVVYKVPELYTDSQKPKLTLIETILKKAESEGKRLNCATICDSELIGKLKTLFDARNEKAHGETPTEANARQKVQRLYPLVADILGRLEALADIHLIHIVGGGLQRRYQVEDFMGYSTHITPHTERLDLDSDDNLTQDRLFAVLNNTAYCVSPFLHYKDVDEDHTRLVYYKRKLSGGKYEFGIVGSSRVAEFDRLLFETERVELQSLLPTLPAPQQPQRRSRP